jgi:DNA-binding transcriptional MerR regulator
MTSLRISEFAARTGVPATTLRFYETAGLLPAGRTTAGYRMYGDDAVARLGFISSAKLLGLPLEEIRDLLDVWEHDACSAVRARMLPLIAARITEADRRQAELAAFSARLAGACEQLAGPAPAGPCGPDCGCSSAPAGPVPTTTLPTRTESCEPLPNVPVACTLGAAELGDRTDQWRRLAAKATDHANLADGLRLTFPLDAELAAEIAALASAERDCCAFLDFTLHLAPGGLELTVRGPEGTEPLLADLFGVTT